MRTQKEHSRAKENTKAERMQRWKNKMEWRLREAGVQVLESGEPAEDTEQEMKADEMIYDWAKTGREKYDAI